MKTGNNKNITMRLVIGLFLVQLFVAAFAAQAAEQVDYTLCDQRVLYLVDNPETVDWPSV